MASGPQVQVWNVLGPLGASLRSESLGRYKPQASPSHYVGPSGESWIFRFICGKYRFAHAHPPRPKRTLCKPAYGRSSRPGFYIKLCFGQFGRWCRECLPAFLPRAGQRPSRGRKGVQAPASLGVFENAFAGRGHCVTAMFIAGVSLAASRKPRMLRRE